MEISAYLEDFIKSLKYNKNLQRTAKKLLKKSGKDGLSQQLRFQDADALGVDIEDSVRSLPRGKDTAIEVYKRLVVFLRKKGVEVRVDFPPIPLDSSFERLMYIAKYLQNEDATVNGLKERLWVSERTIEEDLLRLRGEKDPIRVCGRTFSIPESSRSSGKLLFSSTAHPFFLTENLTQVIVILKGLRRMADDPLYSEYAVTAAADIWQQLSDYAKKRIRFVLEELLPEELTWYEGLEKKEDSFYSERRCSVPGNVLLNCLKNGMPFFIEYQQNGDTVFFENCRAVPGSYCPKEHGFTLTIDCSEGRKTIDSVLVLRSAYSIEELL